MIFTFIMNQQYMRQRRNGQLLQNCNLVMPDIFKILECKKQAKTLKKISQLKTMTLIHNKIIQTEKVDEEPFKLASREEIDKKLNEFLKETKVNRSSVKSKTPELRNSNKNTYYQTLLVFEAQKINRLKVNKVKRNESANKGRISSEDSRLMSKTEINLENLYDESKNILSHFNMSYVNRQEVLKKSEKLHKIHKSAYAIFNSKVKRVF